MGKKKPTKRGRGNQEDFLQRGQMTVGKKENKARKTGKVYNMKEPLEGREQTGFAVGLHRKKKNNANCPPGQRGPRTWYAEQRGEGRGSNLKSASIRVHHNAKGVKILGGREGGVHKIQPVGKGFWVPNAQQDLFFWANG